MVFEIGDSVSGCLDALTGNWYDKFSGRHAVMEELASLILCESVCKALHNGNVICATCPQTNAWTRDTIYCSLTEESVNV